MRKIFVFTFVLFFLCQPLLFAVIDSNEKFLQSFEKNYSKNSFYGKNYLRGEGKGALSLADRGSKNKKCLHWNFDLKDGSVDFVMQVKNNVEFSRYNSICIDVKGDADFIVLRLEDDYTHEYVLSNIKNAWQECCIPFNSFSKKDLFDAKKIKSFNITIDANNSKKQGNLFLDNIVLKNIKDKGFESLLPCASRVKVSKTGSLFNFRSKFIHDKYKGNFLGVKFEVSSDKKKWFFVGEDLNCEDLWFAAEWNSEFFERGAYFVRSVALYDNGAYRPSVETEINILNSFDYNDLIDRLQLLSFKYFLNQKNDKELINENSESGAQSSVFSSAVSVLVNCVAASANIIDRESACDEVLYILSYFAELPKIYGFFPAKLSDAGLQGDVFQTGFFCMSAVVAENYFNKSSNENEKKIRQLCRRIYSDVNWKKAVVDVYGGNVFAEQVFKDKAEGVFEGSSAMVFPYILSLGFSEQNIDAGMWVTIEKALVSKSRFGKSFFDFEGLGKHLYASLFFPEDFIAGNTDFSEDVLAAVSVDYEYLRHLNRNSYFYGLKDKVPDSSGQSYDGTICPSFMTMTLPVFSSIAKAGVYQLFSEYGGDILGQYGFYESINLDKMDFNKIFTAHNLGLGIVQIENYKTGFIYNLLESDLRFKKALRKMEG